MFAQLFGSYLESNNIIDSDVKSSMQEKLSSSRTRLGVIAVTEGLISSEQADEINHIQVTENKRFGDIAIEKGYLKPTDIDKLISLQGNEFNKYIQLLGDEAGFDMSTINSHLEAFKKVNGFTEEEFNSLKADNYKALIDLYCPVGDNAIRKLVEVVINNVTRFVSTDFYFDRLKKVNDLDYAVTIGIKGLEASKNIYLGFSALDNVKGITALASEYAIDVELLTSNDVYDAVGEFANMNMGLLSSEISDSLNIELLPPNVYIGQKARGTCYILPIHLHDTVFHVVVSASEDFSIGDNEYIITSNKCEVYDEETTNKRVVIVDDSIFVRKVLRGILEGANYTIVGEATNGIEAIDLYKKLKPDILTLDITMPEMDGIEALKGIMEFDSSAKVVMVSAAGQQNKIVEAIKLGASLFITKPFENDNVIDSINRL